MHPWERAARLMGEADALAGYDGRLGGSPAEARRELLLLSEFGTALRQLAYRDEVFRDCWIQMDESVTRYKKPTQPAPWLVNNPQSLACWFEFEALVTAAAGHLDRLGKVLALSHKGLASRRLDTNIEKIRSDKTLYWALRSHSPWVSYLADLRNTGLHRILLSQNPVATVVAGRLNVLLPDHESLRDRSKTDPRQLSYDEDRDLWSTTRTWVQRIPELTLAIFDDYFVIRNR